MIQTLVDRANISVSVPQCGLTRTNSLLEGNEQKNPLYTKTLFKTIPVALTPELLASSSATNVSSLPKVDKRRCRSSSWLPEIVK